MENARFPAAASNTDSVRRRHILMIAVLAAVVGGAVWLVHQPQKPSAARLPDGTIVKLGSVSYGKRHRFVTGNTWQRMVGRVLPDKLAEKIGAGVHAFSTSADEMVVFVELSHQGRTRAPRGGYSAMPMTVSDDLGNEFEHNGESYRSQSASNLACGFEIPMGGHLSGNIRLRVFPFDYARQTNYSAEFRLENAGPRLASHWTAPGIAQTNQLGDISVVLLVVERIQASAATKLWQGVHTEFFTRAGLQLLQNEIPSRRWKVAGVSVQDDAGNVYNPPAFATSETNSVIYAEFSGCLSPAESWKYRFELTRQADFNSNEIWRVNRLSVANASPISTELQGFAIQMYHFTREGARVIISPAPTGFEWFLNLEDGDQAGWQVKNVVSGGGLYPSNYRGGFGYSIPESVKSVDMEFFFTKSQFTEFLARPGIE